MRKGGKEGGIERVREREREGRRVGGRKKGGSMFLGNGKGGRRASKQLTN